MKRIGEALLELFRAYLAGFFLFSVLFVCWYHSGAPTGAPAPAASLGKFFGLAVFCGLVAIPAALVLRFFPVGDFGTVLFGILIGAFTIAVTLGQKQEPDPALQGLIPVLGGLLGLFVGLLEVARRRRKRQARRHATAARAPAKGFDWREAREEPPAP
ncbi:MAG: hypothetical protein AB1486_23455 [Planctomycetota bacterium]